VEWRILERLRLFYGGYSDVFEFLVDPMQPTLTALPTNTGRYEQHHETRRTYCTGLTRDERSGLAYL